MNISDITSIIQNRRSIIPNMFTDGRIEKEDIIKLINNAHAAPNHKKTRPWRWQIFTGDGRVKLSHYLAEYYLKNTPQEKQSDIQLKKASEKPLQSPCSIAIIMHSEPEAALPEWEEVAAVACAVQNLWLSASAAGYGGFWSTPKAMLEATDFLGLKENERCLGVFYLGIPAITPPPYDRGNPEDHIKWVE